MVDNRRVELIAELGPGLREVGRARRVLARALDRWDVGGPAVEIALLLASELVTNAVRHGGPPVVVRAGMSREGALRIDVTDDDPGHVRLQQAMPDDDGGRGLYLVDRLSDRWGYQATRFGKRVWFEVDAR